MWQGSSFDNRPSRGLKYLEEIALQQFPRKKGIMEYFLANNKRLTLADFTRNVHRRDLENVKNTYSNGAVE